MPALTARCKGCGRPIQGDALAALDAYWHPDHFRCAGCGAPIRETRFDIDAGRPWHESCFLRMKAPRCAHCGKPIAGARYQDPWGAWYCAAHAAELDRCPYCDRSIPPGGCAACRATAVTTPEQAQPIFTHVLHWCKQQGLRFAGARFRVQLYDQAKMSQAAGAPSSGVPLGFTRIATHFVGGQVLERKVLAMNLVRGLPAILFESLAAHELGHVWLGLHGVCVASKPREEGFCQYLSYRYLRQSADPAASYYAHRIEADEDPVYGGGFRAVRPRADQLGLPRFVSELAAPSQGRQRS